jgi:polysaccharide biosynthesis protein PslA
VAQVQQLDGDVADLDHDRRVTAEDTVAPAPLDIGQNVVAHDYPPAAVSVLFLVQALAVFVLGRMAASLFGIAATEGSFGPHQLIFATAAILFPILASLEGSLVTRVRGIVAMWGMRLIAPLAVAQLSAVAVFTMLYPNLLLAPSESALLHWFAVWFAACYVAGGLLNSGLEVAIRRRERQGKSVRHVVVFGGGPHGQRFIDALTRQPNPLMKIDAFFDERAKSIPNRIADIPFGGGGDELIAYVQHHAIDEIFIALPWSADSRILDILRKFRPLPASVRLAPESTLLHPALAGHQNTGMALAPVIRRTPLSLWGQFFKSIVDRLVAAVALLWFSPLLLAIAAAIKLTSRGPVYFRQSRLGFNNLPFSVYKFRTMRVATGAEQTLKQATRNDSRVTPVGAFLRRWSLDELPQLLNVLCGDMSLVGPRPHPMWRKASDLWEQGGSEPLDAIIHEYAARHRVKPGITGWAQISGYRGETATVDRMHKRVELDVYYIDHWSLWFDIKIILRTFVALFQSQDAY